MTAKHIFIIVPIAIVGFLGYRYFVWGKGNKGLICPSLFGYGEDSACKAKITMQK